MPFDLLRGSFERSPEAGEYPVGRDLVSRRNRDEDRAAALVGRQPVTAFGIGEYDLGAVRYGYADAILAGGSEAAITPMGFAGFINCMSLSTSEDPEAASIPFDKRRGGFVMGEGAGALLLEEYEHAKARGAKIYAEISGYGCTCDAYHVTAPHPEAEGGARAIRLAVEETGKTPDAARVYINAHGTSTPLNDKAETAAIKKVFGADAYRVLVSSI